VTQASVPDTPEAIQADFPAYRIWLSSRGSMWGATRIDGTKGVDPTVIKDSPEDLRLALEDQAELAERQP
jgi:hypothetical protein